MRFTLLSCLLLVACSKGNIAKREFLAEKLLCPPPAKESFEPWGESGSQHVCEIKHGPFVVFESGRIQLRGQFENGKEVGVWRWYDADGKVAKEISYSPR